MEQGQFYLDSNGSPRAQFASRCAVLGWYLEQDVQASPKVCDELLSICDDISNDARDSWSGTGNAHSISITSANVVIENVFANDAPPCELTIREFRAAVASWKALITN
jgi:hypothetical protein